MFSYKYLIMFFTSITIVLFSACSAQPNRAIPGTDIPEIGDLDEFVSQVRNNGATVEIGEQLSQPFFDPAAQIVRINENDVQVFEFSDVASREAAQATISADGTSIGTSMVSWMDTPHFWGKGRLIILYVGSDTATINLLNTILD